MTLAASPSHFHPLLWDIFCRVIDNFGDLGVCWRLSSDLAQRGHRVRLWVDDSSALQWMAPGALEGEWPRVQILDWEQALDAKAMASLTPADVWIEGFGCEIAPEFIALNLDFTWAIGLNDVNFPVWINLEYLSAESYVERAHALPSPVMQGPALGHTKYFYYPGFTERTGGLLREPALIDAHQRFDTVDAKRGWLTDHGVDWNGEFIVSLFCYEPAPLAALLRHWASQPRKTRLLVAAGRATQAVQSALARLGQAPIGAMLQITYLPLLRQTEFDQLLRYCDLNCVRGEDSLVRAIWAGKPLLWHLYPQDDGAHHSKLQAFFTVLKPPASMLQMHVVWNGLESIPQGMGNAEILPIELSTWQSAVQALRAELLQMDDLTTQLIEFVQKKR